MRTRIENIEELNNIFKIIFDKFLQRVNAHTPAAQKVFDL